MSTNDNFEREVRMYKRAVLTFIKNHFKVTDIECNNFERRDLNIITRKVLQHEEEYVRRRIRPRIETNTITDKSFLRFQILCEEITFQFILCSYGLHPLSLLQYKREDVCDLICRIRYESNLT